MAKPNSWQEEVSQGVELAGTIRQAVVAANATTATPLSSTPTNILWVMIQNLGTVNIYIGSSTVTNTGSTRGILARPQGETPVIKVDDLSKVYVIASSGTPDVAYLAGWK